jgi:hypothetical protein
MHINRQLILSMYVCITLSVYLPHNPLYEVLPILFAGVSFYLAMYYYFLFIKKQLEYKAFNLNLCQNIHLISIL